MKLRLVGVAPILLGLASIGCVPLTFSHEEALDFDTYQTAYLEVLVTDAAVYYGAENARQYLLSELRDGSGFKRVVVDPSQPVDVTLTVRLSVVEVAYGTDEGVDFEYDSSARFTLTDSLGGPVDSGDVADTSTYPEEAVEDALDEVALHFLKPYRL